jgi:FtsP/CotA-like multicopper oxidase with cupredoxin domain
MQSNAIATTWITYFAVALVFFLSLTIWTSINRQQPQNIHPVEQASTGVSIQSSFDKLLHPEEHVTRSPIVLSLDWRISAGIRSPDGVSKRVYLINDAFPGPLIECRPGDTLMVRVSNMLENEGVAIHFHGLHMRGSNHMDGAIGFTQDPILPGETFTYQFLISNDQIGTFWYHAHDHVQRGDGLFGALVIHRPSDMAPARTEISAYEYDEERIMMVGDWYHRSANDALAWYMRSGSFGIEPVPDSMLVSGIGAYNCSKAVPARPVECTQIAGKQIPSSEFNSTKTYRLRIINTGMLAGVSISILGASLTVIEVDGGHGVAGKECSSFGILFPGQRVDLIIKWTSASSPSSMTIDFDEEAFRTPNLALSTSQSFPIRISDLKPDTNGPDEPVHFDLGEVQSHGITERMPPRLTDATFVLYTTTLKLARLSNVPRGFMNHTTWEPQSPPLISIPRSQYDSHQLVPNISITSPPSWVDIVLNNLDEDNHPFHLHGHDAYILQTFSSTYGWGSWNPFETDVAPGGPLNVVNPVVRDTFIVPRRGYVVLRIRADNAGIWMFHCHVLWHQASGMAMGFEMTEHG